MKPIKLEGLDLKELRELREQFMLDYSHRLYAIKEAERQALEEFINSFSNRYYAHGLTDVLSLDEYGLTMEERHDLSNASDQISSGFRALDRLKNQVFKRATREGVPLSKVFKTSIKRMKKYQSK